MAPIMSGHSYGNVAQFVRNVYDISGGGVEGNFAQEASQTGLEQHEGAKGGGLVAMVRLQTGRTLTYSA